MGVDRRNAKRHAGQAWKEFRPTLIHTSRFDSAVQPSRRVRPAELPSFPSTHDNGERGIVQTETDLSGTLGDIDEMVKTIKCWQSCTIRGGSFDLGGGFESSTQLPTRLNAFTFRTTTISLSLDNILYLHSSLSPTRHHYLHGCLRHGARPIK